MKIIKFQYFKESIALPTTHLKNEQYFKDYFTDLLDEGYKIEISISYVRRYTIEGTGKHEFDIGSYSDYPRKGYCPRYRIQFKFSDQKNHALKKPEYISNFINIVSIFNNCFNNLLHDSEIFIYGAVDISKQEFPWFDMGLIENIDLPNEELPDEVFYEFFNYTKACIGHYDDMTELSKDDTKKTISMRVDAMKQQTNVILNNLKKLKIRKNWSSSFEFDLKEVNNRKPYIIEISNIRKVEPLKKSE